jgi:uncharacterized protein YndB with AHSA1/START domain
MRILRLGRAIATQQVDLWDAFAKPSRLSTWFMPFQGEIVEGKRFQFENFAGGEVLDCDFPTRITTTWELGEERSWLELTLEELSQGCRFLLEHETEVSEANWREYGPGVQGVGWDLALVSLSDHILSQGRTTREEGQSWVRSEPGRAFIRRSSEAWSLMSIAVGTEPEIARIAADRTTEYFLERT